MIKKLHQILKEFFICYLDTSSCLTLQNMATTIGPFIPEKLSYDLLWPRLTQDVKGTIYTSTAYKRGELLI